MTPRHCLATLSKPQIVGEEGSMRERSTLILYNKSTPQILRPDPLSTRVHLIAL